MKRASLASSCCSAAGQLGARQRATRGSISSRGTAPLFVSRRLVRDGKAAYREAKRLGWEGIIAKDERSPYQPGIRSPFWRKVKVRKESEVVIGGDTPPA